MFSPKFCAGQARTGLEARAEDRKRGVEETQRSLIRANGAAKISLIKRFHPPAGAAHPGLAQSGTQRRIGKKRPQSAGERVRIAGFHDQTGFQVLVK